MIGVELGSSSSSSVGYDDGVWSMMIMSVFGGLAMVMGLGIALGQTDFVSRKYLLNPDRLSWKRCRCYLYWWQQELTASISKIRQHSLHHGFLMEAHDTLKSFELLITDNLLDEFIHDDLLPPSNKNQKQKDKSSMKVKKVKRKNVSIIGMARDEKQSTLDWFLYLKVQYYNEDDDDRLEMERCLQVPLVSFGVRLRKALDQSSTMAYMGTFCFVADASSSLSADFLLPLLTDHETLNMCVWNQPVWMAMMAYLFDQRIYASAKLDQTLSALLQLLATLNHNNSNNKQQKLPYQTIVVLLPGQSTTHVLLPSLIRSFPHDRHVFAYSSLKHAISHSHTTTTKTNNKKKKDDSNEEDKEDVTIMPTTVSANIPLDSRNLLLKKVKNLDGLLAKLSLTYASTVHAWMSSVDTFLSLKDTMRHDEYLPFVHKLEFLQDIHTINSTANIPTVLYDTDDINNNNNNNPPSYTTSYVALSNLLHYMTGTRSRPLTKQLIDTIYQKHIIASSYIPTNNNTATTTTTIDEQTQTFIEACAFAHKSILIENKTFTDTVLPKQHWTLLAAKKLKSCACCLEPGADEDDEDDENENPSNNNNNNNNQSKTNTTDDLLSIANNNKNDSLFTDGKSAFAFDPSKFTGIQLSNNNNNKQTIKKNKQKTTFTDGKSGFAFDPSKFTGVPMK